MDRTLISGTTIFDGSGAEPFAGDVLVEGQRIAAVQRGGSSRAAMRGSSTAPAPRSCPGSSSRTVT